jgi:hypothetical protein
MVYFGRVYDLVRWNANIYDAEILTKTVSDKDTSPGGYIANEGEEWKESNELLFCHGGLAR